MAGLIFAIIVALIAAGVIFGAGFGKYPRNPKIITIIGGVLGLFAAFGLLLAGMYHSVPTKSVGVVTSQGRVIGNPYSPGGYWLAPWRSLNIVQDTIQSDKFFQSNNPSCASGQVCSDIYTNSGANGYCITVRLGGSQEGCADVQLQTQTEEKALPVLYANYSSYGTSLTQDVDQYVVKRDLITVLNHTLGDYNPIADVTSTLNLGGTSQFSTFDPTLLAQMRADLLGEVDVLNLNLQYVHYDSETQSRINSIATQYADTQVAKVQEQTNAAISAANAALVKSNSLSPAVLQNECYTTTQLAIKDNYGLPTGWNCSSSTSSSLILPGK